MNGRLYFASERLANFNFKEDMIKSLHMLSFALLILLAFPSCEKREVPSDKTSTPVGQAAPDKVNLAPSPAVQPEATEAPKASEATAPKPSDTEKAAAPRPQESDAAPVPAPSPEKVAFVDEKSRAEFEVAVVKGDIPASLASGESDPYAAIETWARSVQDSKALDAAIERLEAASTKDAAPPHIAFALAALYGRKGLIQKQYAALARCEGAAKARPDLVFALSAVYGRKETLKSKYGADELLVGGLRAESDPPDARVLVDGAERGRTPLSVDRLREGKHRLRLESDNYDPWETPFDVDTGRETLVSAKLGAKPGSLEVSTTPPTKLRLDAGDYEAAPHIYEGLAAGEHTLSVAGVLVGKRYYGSLPDEAVAVQPGQKLVVKKTLQIGRSKVKIDEAPGGSSFYVDGSKSDDTAAFGSGLEVDSGISVFKVVAPNGQAWYREYMLSPKESWICGLADMCAILPRRTIKIDAGRGAWGDVIGLFSPLKGYGVLFGMDLSGVYLCRDDKYLYWRIDFATTSPFEKPPKGVVQDVYARLSLEYNALNNTFNIEVFRDMKDGRMHSNLGDWDGIKRKGVYTRDPPSVSIQSGKDSLILRVALDALAPYMKGLERVDFNYTQRLRDYSWSHPSSDSRMIDFSQ